MYKLLLVDDEDVIRSGLKLILDREFNGVLQTIEASNGRHAANMIDKYEPEIIITDIRMPYIDGLELIRLTSKRKTNKPVFIILSGYEDFYYAKQAIEYGVKNYLLKPVDKVEIIKLLKGIINEFNINFCKQKVELQKKEQIEEEIQYIRGKYLNELIKTGNDNNDMESLKKKLYSLGICLDYSLFTIMIIECRTLNNSRILEIDRSIIENVVGEVIQGLNVICYSFSDSKMRMVFLLCTNEKSFGISELKNIYEQTCARICNHRKIEFFIAAGSNAQDVMNIHQSYLDALDVLNYKVIKSPGYLFFDEKIKVINAENSVLSAYLVKITTKIDLCQNNDLVELIDQMFFELDLKNADISKLFAFYSDFTKYIYNYFLNAGFDYSLVFGQKESDFKGIDFFWSIEHLKIYLKQCLLKICDIISSLNSIGYERKIIDQVIGYIKEYYDKDINLNTIADVFNKNNCYLSVLFKKEIGVNFTDYLTSLRIEKAKELLTNKDLNIKELSNQVGYMSPKHFSSVFKNATGISPKQYREKIRRNSRQF